LLFKPIYIFHNVLYGVGSIPKKVATAVDKASTPTTHAPKVPTDYKSFFIQNPSFIFYNRPHCFRHNQKAKRNIGIIKFPIIDPMDI